MIKLLYAGFRRYTKSYLFWIAFALNIVLAIVCGMNTRSFYLEDFYLIIQLSILVILFTFYVGRENDEGLFRNKIIVGHSKGSIYLSEIILGLTISLIFSLSYSVIFIILNNYIFYSAIIWALTKFFFNYILVVLTFTIVYITIACLVPKKAITAIINVLLIFAIAFLAYNIDSKLSIPEYITVYEYETITETDENGDTYTFMQPIPGSGHEVYNEDYIDGFQRKVYLLAFNILPSGQIIDDISIMNDYFGYHNVEENKEFLEPITKEFHNTINVNLLFSISSILVLIPIGYFLFIKKQFK